MYEISSAALLHLSIIRACAPQPALDLYQPTGRGGFNGAFLDAGGSPDEYRAGLDRAIAKGWLWRHESGTYVKFTPLGAELFA
jgi:hypothetical protein